MKTKILSILRFVSVLSDSFFLCMYLPRGGRYVAYYRYLKMKSNSHFQV